MKKSLDRTSTLKDLFDIARAEDGNLGNADISLIQVRNHLARTGTVLGHRVFDNHWYADGIIFSPFLDENSRVLKAASLWWRQAFIPVAL